MIRRVAPDDAQRIRAIRLRALADAPASFASTLEEEAAYPAAFWEEWARDDAEGEELATFLAVRDDAVLGIVAAYRDAESARAFHVIAMWVEPEHRRQGLAAALLARAEEWVLASGGEIAELKVTNRAHGARALYEGAGYVVVGDASASAHTDGVVHRRMRKALRPAR